MSKRAKLSFIGGILIVVAGSAYFFASNRSRGPFRSFDDLIVATRYGNVKYPAVEQSFGAPRVVSDQQEKDFALEGGSTLSSWDGPCWSKHNRVVAYEYAAGDFPSRWTVQVYIWVDASDHVCRVREMVN